MEGYLEDGEYEKLKDNVDFIETTANLFRQNKDKGLDYEFALGEAFVEAQKEFIEKGNVEKKAYHVEASGFFACADEKIARQEMESYAELIDGIVKESIQVVITDTSPCEEAEFQNETTYYMAVEFDVQGNSERDIEENVKDELYGLWVSDIVVSKKLNRLEERIQSAEIEEKEDCKGQKVVEKERER